jgi:hypothetical protein
MLLLGEIMENLFVELLLASKNNVKADKSFYSISILNPHTCSHGGHMVDT